jgi:transcription-repair coupling factor (superfamily II helicase)
MADDELEQVMIDFVAHKFDILVATTIVESGLDIPNANTIFIDEADRYGLADLHQLRGRVGRYKHRAYCYLLTDPNRHLTPNASRRLRAIEEFSEMGAGFAISMRDLEIRGAGNLLGAQQSGHIASVGFDLYCQLLKRTVAALKGEALPAVIDCELKLDFIDLSPMAPDDETAAVLPAGFVEDETLRIRLYREIASASSLDELDHVQRDIADRYGRLPAAVERLLMLARLRVAASLRGLKRVEVEEDKAMLSFGGDRYFMPGGRFPRLRAGSASAKLEELMKLVKASSRKHAG